MTSQSSTKPIPSNYDILGALLVACDNRLISSLPRGTAIDIIAAKCGISVRVAASRVNSLVRIKMISDTISEGIPHISVSSKGLEFVESNS